MDVIAVINYKGGVGKTTVTSNLAAELAFRGKRVLVIDTDAQASLTFSFITPDHWDREYKEKKTIKSWFDAICQGQEPPSLENFIISPQQIKSRIKSGCVDLICSHLGLINVDLDLATLLGAANMRQAQKNYLKVHGKLREEIRKPETSRRYDIVLIDCPPNFNIVTKNSIVASDKILIPAKPDYLSTLGIDYLHKSVKELVENYNDYALAGHGSNTISPQILGVVFTMIQITSGNPIAAQKQYISQTKRLGLNAFNNYFRENKTIFADAPRDLVPVVLNRYTASTHTEIVQEIEAFVSEFESFIWK